MRVVKKTRRKKQLQTWNRMILFGFFILAAVATFSLVNSTSLLELFTRAGVGQNTNIVFVDQDDRAITETKSPFVNLRLTSPWSGIAMNEAGFQSVAGVQAVQGTFNLIAQVKTGGDDVYEDGSSYNSSDRATWVGTSGSTMSSWTGYRFSGVNVPKGAVIDSARLLVYSDRDQWISISMQIYGENIGNSGSFGRFSKPSSRTRTSAMVPHSSNSRWNANTWYELGDLKSVIQSVISRSDWQSGNSMSVIMKGSGNRWGKKYVSAYEKNSSLAPRLVVTYTIDDSQPIATPTSFSLPTATPTVPATPTPVPFTTSVELAENSEMTRNYIKLPYTSHPMTATYTFSDNFPGRKTIYARFTSSNGQSQIFSNWIDLVAEPTATPIPTTPPTGGHDGHGSNGHAMGLWTPNPKYDTCTNSTDTARIKEIHDSYKVQGPDGKWYPTWHPPVDPVTGCKFGHEHGRDPHQSALWSFIQQQYGYDADGNGRVEGSELATAGLPFGYANEQLDVYNTANNVANAMRHEDHVGHKIEWENNVQRTTSPNYLPSSPSNNFGKVETKVYCDFLQKPHQGTHSKDAFTNNLHELGYFVQCRDAQGGGVGTKIGAYKMVVFGKKGGFTDRGDPGTGTTGSRVEVGLATPLNGPDMPDPSRLIPTARSVANNILVPSGEWSRYSEGIYEDWISANYLMKPDGNWVAYFDPHFAVFSPSRFYWAGSDTNTYGITRSAEDKAGNIGRSVDICNMTENGGAERARGGECDYMTNYGQIKGIAWDDPRSVFNGIHREMYFNQNGIHNAGGPTAWYTDPFGNKASATPFTGSIKQYVSSVNNELKTTDGFISSSGIRYPFESEAIGGNRSYGGNGVHAPN